MPASAFPSHAAARRAALAALVLLVPGTRSASPAPPLEDLRLLATADRSAASSGRPVRVRGIVAFADSSWRLLFLTNGSEALFVDPLEQTALPSPGEEVEVEGVSSFAVDLPGVAKPRITPLGRAPIPSPGTQASPNDRPVARLATIRGTIRQSREGIERDTMIVASAGIHHSVIVLREGVTPLPARGAEVEITGVLVPGRGPFHALGTSTLLAASHDDIRVTTAAPDLASLPFLSLADAARAFHRGEVGRLVRVRGTVVDRRANANLVIEDATGRLDVASDRSVVTHGIEIEYSGFLSSTSRSPQLEDVTSRLTGVDTVLSRRDPSATPVTSIAELRTMSAREADRGHPVTVEGIVTFANLSNSQLFVQEGSMGVYVSPKVGTADLRFGDRVILSGWSSAGRLAPIVEDPDVTILARGQTPPPLPTDALRLHRGQDDCRFVEVVGRVRSVRWLPDRTELRIEMGSGTVTAVLQRSEGRLGPDILDARVHVRGVAMSLFNWRGQLSHVELSVPEAAHIVVTQRAAVMPLALPAVTARDVLRPAEAEVKSTRVRVRAVVTAVDPTGRLFVRDETSPLVAFLAEPMPLQPGDVVDIAGFPTPGPDTPLLEDSVVRVVSRGTPSPPIQARVDAVREGIYDSDLVSMEATLLQAVETPREWRLVLHSGDTVFDARLGGARAAAADAPAPGSLVRIQGVAILHESAGEPTGSFSLLLRSAQDVSLVTPPPIWTADRARATVVVLGICILGAIVWAATLRRQVRQQTALIQRQATREQELDQRYRDDLEALVWQRTRELEEAQEELVRRERLSTLGRLTATVSHELRNPLGTIRGSLFVIGNAVRGLSPAVERAIERAERNVLRCDTIIEELLEYTRIRELLPQATNLDTWIGEVLDEIPVPAGLVLERDLRSGVVVRIDRNRVQRCIVNLVSNACEALTASASHSAERLAAAAHDRLRVTTRIAPGRVLISVADNGPGISDEDRRRIFEPFFSTKSFGIGLGLAIVRQIAQQHSGGVTVETDPGRRTEFTVWLPSALVEGEANPSTSTSEGAP